MSGWRPIIFALVLALATVPRAAQAQSSADVTINSSEPLFCVLAALNAAGYNTGLFVNTGDDTRLSARRVLEEKHAPVVAQIEKFYAAHRLADPGADLAQYISLALFLGPAPQFNFTVATEDLPPDASDVRDLVPLLRTFYRQADLDDLYERLHASYLSVIQRYAPEVRREIALTDGYLRFPSGSYLGRTYHIYICLLGDPGQAQARIYGDNYYLVITPSARPPFEKIRYQYLHFLLDPLAVKYAPDIHRKAALQVTARKAPALGQDFKNDFSFLVTECLINAVELRMDKPPEVEKRLNADLANGLILTPYFYQSLAAYEKQVTPMSAYFQQMVDGIDLKKMEKELATVKFAQPAPAPQARAAPEVSLKEHLLDEGDDLIYQQKYDQAKAVFQQVLTRYGSNDGRALYGLAIVASNLQEPDVAEDYFKKTLSTARDLRLVTWSHIYLGRIYDLEGKRSEALKQYRAASVTATRYPEALAALQEGLQRPFGSKGN